MRYLKDDRRGCRASLDWTAEGGCPYMTLGTALYSCVPF